MSRPVGRSPRTVVEAPAPDFAGVLRQKTEANGNGIAALADPAHEAARRPDGQASVGPAGGGG